MDRQLPEDGIRAQALQLLGALHADTADWGPHWHSIGSLSEYSADALQLAINRKWLLLDPGQRVCLTDKGREIAKG